MGLTMQEKQAVTKQLALDYKRATKKEKEKILDWLVQLTGYNRSYAARVLRQRARPKLLGRLKDGDVKITLIEDERTNRRKKRRERPRKYGKEVLVALRKIWVVCDCICSKRLAPYDNAQAESFIKTLKYEEVYLYEYEDLAEARRRIGHFLEAVYNEKRLHSALGYVPPAEFERSQAQPQVA